MLFFGVYTLFISILLSILLSIESLILSKYNYEKQLVNVILKPILLLLYGVGLIFLFFNTEVANSLAVEIINRINRFRIIESFLSSKEIGLYILAFIILLQVVFIFWAVYKGFIENEL
ncbi:hypothetical protein JQ005_001469 [Campylobacter coli]|nr:hypothetical protein [Campylobacter coli]EHB3069340.1 hypothetical protein [Campylobacter coli]EHD5970437.1 hypothetical protein [Campylobacter coli]